MSLLLKPLDVSNKSELISLGVGQLKEEPFSLAILDRQVGTRESGFADLVVANRDGRIGLLYLLEEENPNLYFSALSNYLWACENIAHFLKMYPQAALSSAQSPEILFLARRFPGWFKKALTLLKCESVRALRYQAFSASGLPCLLLEEEVLCDGKGVFQEIELQKLKKEYATGSRYLSEEEILAFLNLKV